MTVEKGADWLPGRQPFDLAPMTDAPASPGGLLGPNVRTVVTTLMLSKSMLDNAPRFDLGALIAEEMAPLSWRTKVARRRALRHVKRHVRRRCGTALRSLARKVEPSWRCQDCIDREAAEHERWDD